MPTKAQAAAPTNTHLGGMYACSCQRTQHLRARLWGDAMSEPAFHGVSWMAERLGRHERWVRRHISEIPHHKIGGRYQFTEANFEQYVNATKVDPADALRPTRAPRRGRRSAA